jgi:diacylglycerol kinase (ATP)
MPSSPPPEGLREWAQVVTSLRKGGAVEGLKRYQGHHVEIIVERPLAHQLVGDTAGNTSTLTAQVAPAALQVMRSR